MAKKRKTHTSKPSRKLAATFNFIRALEAKYFTSKEIFAALAIRNAALKAKKLNRDKKRKERNIKKNLRTRQAKYCEYLKSNWWKQRRYRSLRLAGFKCQECTNTTKLEVHHLHYRSLWREKDEDLVVLCRYCHSKKHPDKGLT